MKTLIAKIPKPTREWQPFDTELFNQGGNNKWEVRIGKTIMTRVLCTDKKHEYPIVACHMIMEDEMSSGYKPADLQMRSKSEQKLPDPKEGNLFLDGNALHERVRIEYQWED